MNVTRLVWRVNHWLLTVIIGIFLVTGFGISEFRTVERLTFGLLTKQLAFRIHSELWLPLVVLLVLHLYFTRAKR